jgi:Fungal protein of unknown function (DUF1752)
VRVVWRIAGPTDALFAQFSVDILFKMSLYFVNSRLNHPVVARSVDDLHLRKPILLAPHQANPLIDNIHLQYLGPTWRLATTGRDELLQGKRFENALWRLWGQQLLGAKKVERTKEVEPMM